MVKRIMFLTNKECIPFIHSKAPGGKDQDKYAGKRKLTIGSYLPSWHTGHMAVQRI